MTDRLAEIRARLDALVCPRPWRYRYNRGVTDARDETITKPGWYDADGTFVANAPADIAWLLDEVGAARREIRDEIARLTKTKAHAINAGQFGLAAEINDSIRALGRSFFGRTPDA